MILTNDQIYIIEDYLTKYHDLDPYIDQLSLEQLYKIIINKIKMED